MPNPNFSKPWHGVPREDILWNPTVIEDACIGCGTCVTGCSRLVYRFDFDRKKPVVVDPLNCMVGCTTCANTCPAHAIEFPPLISVLALQSKAEVRHAVEDDLLERYDILASNLSIPHPDRIITLGVETIEQVTENILRVILKPVTAGECFCEFMPGQYIELWQPNSSYLSRSYSIANAPHEDGRITVHIRRVEGGRFTGWAFTEMKTGDTLQARGPLGDFTMRSAPDVPLLFLAGGTGLAPVLALLEQQIDLFPERHMTLVWGLRSLADFYEHHILESFMDKAPNLAVTLVTFIPPNEMPKAEKIQFSQGYVMDVIRQENLLANRPDIYAAGPALMLRELVRFLDQQGVEKNRMHIDSFAV